MGEIRRAADGRRLFSAEFKRERIGRVVRGEMTLAELSRAAHRLAGRAEG